MSPRAPALALVLGVAATAAGAEIHARVAARPDARPLGPAPAPTHRVALRAVLLTGSRWTHDAVDGRLARTREILAQCGVRLDVTLVELSAPWGSAGVLYDPARGGEAKGMGTLVSALAQPKPTLFYIARFLDNEMQTGTSRPPFTSAGAPEADTAWVVYTEDPPGWQSAYQVDAHELVHVLADTPHWSPAPTGPPRAKGDPPDPDYDAGLMAGNPMIRTDRLAPELCARIKARPYAEPLPAGR